MGQKEYSRSIESRSAAKHTAKRDKDIETEIMTDNRVRLSKDVVELAEQIAILYGLKGARQAIEMLVRLHAKDHLPQTTQQQM